MAWNEITPEGMQDKLRQALLAGIQESYDENCRRFAAEDLGDNNVNFSHNIRENLRFLVQRNVEIFPEVEVFWRGPLYELRLPGNMRVHIYKAPPGAIDVRQLRFDASQRQVEILEVNAEQLVLRLEEAAMDSDDDAQGRTPRRHIVVVHFGDPVSGLSHVEVGEPFLSNLDAPDWLWVESLTDGTLLYERDRSEEADLVSYDMDDDDFGDLALRDEPDEDSADGPTGTAR